MGVVEDFHPHRIYSLIAVGNQVWAGGMMNKIAIFDATVRPPVCVV